MIAQTRERHPFYVWAWSLVRLDFVGIAFGALFFCLSLTPSLLPRDWLFQGLIGGLNAAIGYGIGVFGWRLFRRFVIRRRKGWPPSKRVQYVGKTVTVVLAIAASVLMLIPAAAWQRQVSAVVGIEGPTTLGYLRTLIIAVLAGGACVGAARILIDLIKTMARFFIRRWRLNDEVALFIGTAIVVVLVITLINGVAVRGFLAGANRVFQPQNFTTRPGIVQPLEPEKSGSPESFAAWDTLGYQGRNFVATGPDAEELTRLNGRPAKEPIRAYVGLQTADTDEQRMAVLLSELERTGAFERKLLVIIPTTGTGWINPLAARSLEMMYNGDTALVGSQYSYLPSWISFLGDQQKSMESGRMMIDAIHERWAKLPPDRRPKLVLYGESLGSMARPGCVRVAARHRRYGLLLCAVGGPAEREPTVARHHRTPRPRHPGGQAALRQRPNGPVLRGHRRPPDRHRGGDTVGGHPGAVHAAPVGSGRLVVGGSDFQQARLAEGTAGPRPHGVDAMVSDHHVLAGRR